MTRFDICLAQTLQFETSYQQPPGGPYVRWKSTSKVRVSPLESGIPDGLGFDDDPHDTGGRTCMGLIQREYDAWRACMSLDARDVWQIEDRELVEIYKRQYWAPLRCGELPPGVDMMVFDAGVNCGVGIGARLLQRALGVTDDGHIGQVTIAAAQVAEVADLIPRIAAARETYHRKCRTFRIHGNGWLRRTADVTLVALRIGAVVAAPPARGAAPAVPPPADAPAAEIVVDYAANSRRAPLPQPRPTGFLAKIKALALGVSGFGLLAGEASEHLPDDPMQMLGLLDRALPVAERVAASPVGWIAVGCLVAGGAAWLLGRTIAADQAH